jgi:hypothetical protein
MSVAASLLLLDGTEVNHHATPHGSLMTAGSPSRGNLSICFWSGGLEIPQLPRISWWDGGVGKLHAPCLLKGAHVALSSAAFALVNSSGIDVRGIPGFQYVEEASTESSW